LIGIKSHQWACCSEEDIRLQLRFLLSATGHAYHGFDE
jgi:hypothetical protein